MEIDSELNKKYYKNLINCKCDECKLIQKKMPKLYLDVFNFLKEQGINHKKMLDVETFYDEQNKSINYSNCSYLCFGNFEENYQNIINDTTFKINKTSIYAKHNLEDKQVVMSCEPFIVKSKRLKKRHISYEMKYKLVNLALKEFNPFMYDDLNDKSYFEDSIKILDHIKEKKVYKISWKLVKNYLKKDGSINKKQYQEIANRISTYFNLMKTYKNYNENEYLNGKLTFGEGGIILNLHDNFKILYKDNETYINGKFYDNLLPKQMLKFLINFAKNDNIIYVQYLHKHVSIHSGHYIRCFKEVKKNKYNLDTLNHKDDVELVFDNQSTLYIKENNQQDLKAAI